MAGSEHCLVVFAWAPGQKIEYIGKCAFCKTTDLLSLHLDDNNLIHAMADLFSDTWIPNYYYLGGNKIEYIEKKLIDQAKNVLELL